AAGPGGEPGDVRVARRARAAGRGRGHRGGGAGGGAVRVSVLTHRRAGDTAAAIASLVAAARRAGATLRFDPEETRKHGLLPGEGLELDADLPGDVDLCVVMGGDGTILTALREYADTRVPVFAVNFGEVGFLATL